MKKLMLAFAVSAVFVSVASADDAWFTGTIGSEDAGSWTMTPGEGEITTNETTHTLVLNDAKASFTAGTVKKPSEAKLNFSTIVQFQDAYDELPDVGENDKAGVIVYVSGTSTNYWVLAKSGSANAWTDSGVAAGGLTNDTAVSVVVTNGTDGVHALYTIGASTVDKLVAASENWSTVDYSGNGVVASLVGTTEAIGSADYPIPGGKTIPAAVAEDWAEANEIAKDKLAEVLASTQTYTGNRTAAESCLLGVATNADLKAEIADGEASKLAFDLNCTPVAERVVLKVTKDDSFVESGVVVDVDKVSLDIADGIYQVVAYVDGADKQIHVSQKIGVRGTAVAASKVYFIGAPWADCPVTNLFKKTCCAANDKLEVYDSANNRWYTWAMNEGKWSYVKDNGIIGDAEPELVLEKGQAVKYTAAAGTATEAKLYTVGDVSTATTTEIVSGKWNLIAYPDGELAAAKLPLDDTADEVIVLGDDGVTATGVYIKSGDDVYTKAGYNGVWNPASGNVSGGFFFKTKDAELVNWAKEEQE